MANNAVTLDTAKDYLNITSSTDDDNIQTILDAAVSFATEYTGVTFHDGTASEITESVTAVGRSIQTNYHPVLTITSITDRISNTAITSTYYEAGRKCIWMKPGYGTFYEDIRRYEVVYTAGYDSDDIPEGLKIAILMLAAKIYENKSDKSSYNGIESFNILKFIDSTILFLLETYRYKKSRRI